MDLKGINWVGHMYQKYETMLLEVEDDMYQDVVNYVESQVQTVGDSVKKFYSDVIQDLLPPSSDDLLTPQDSDLPIEKYVSTCAYKQPKAGTAEVQVNADAETVIKNPKAIDVEVENHASFYHGLSSVNSSSVSMSADSLNGSCSESYSALYEDGATHNFTNQGPKINTEKKNLPPFVMEGAMISVEEGSRRASGIFSHLHESHEAACDEMAISVSGCDGIEDEVKYESDVSIDGPSSDKSMMSIYIDDKVTEVRLSSCGSLPAESNAASEEDESGEDVINSKNVIELDMKTIQSGHNLRLEESCVVVNGDELNCVPLNKGKGKSRVYKKKIREALSLRKKSARKEEYKQLAVLYADEAAGSNDQSMESLKPDLTVNNKRSSLTHDNGESEWEFL